MRISGRVLKRGMTCPDTQFRKITLDAGCNENRLPKISFFLSEDKVQELPPKGSVGRVEPGKKAEDVWVLGFLSYNGKIGKVSYLGEDFAGGSSLGELILLLLSLQSIPCPFLFLWRE